MSPSDRPHSLSTLDVLQELSNRAEMWHAILADNFIGAYVTGSVSLNAFETASSDIDLIVVVRNQSVREPLTAIAESAIEFGRTVPAAGLELVVVTAQAAKAPSPTFELAVSSGREWHDEIEFDGEDWSLLMDMTICFEHGIPLSGPPPLEVFSPASTDQLKRALTGGLQWHRRWILDTFHDPGGQNSVLNACRAWRWLATDELTSKVAGGEWAIEQGGPVELIQTAIELKRGRPAVPLDHNTIDTFLLGILEKFEAAN